MFATAFDTGAISTMNDDHNVQRDTQTNRLCGMIWVAAGVCVVLLLLADSAFGFLQ